MTERVVCTSREEWLSARRGYITASEAPAVMGLSPWKSPLALYAEKKGLMPEQEENERMAWGRRLQRAIAEGYEEETKREVIEDPDGDYVLSVHPTHVFMAATLDYRQRDQARGEGVLEIKASEAPWEHEPPLPYQIQLQHQLAVTGASYGTLAVLVRGNRLLWADVERNDAFITRLIRKEAEFLQALKDDKPPAVTEGDESTRAALKALYPRDTGVEIPLPTEALSCVEQWEQWKAQSKQADERVEFYASMLKAYIGDASYGRLADGSRVSWKTHVRNEQARSARSYDVRVLRRVK